MNFRVGHRRRHSRRSSTPGRRAFNSGYWTPALMLVLALALLAVAYNHRRGNFHKLRSAVLPANSPAPPQPNPGPGGEPPLRITRPSSAEGVSPEFLSATMLPGRGFEVEQITAAIPGHGEVNLLHVPEDESVDDALNGKGDDIQGAHSLNLGGAFLAPWTGRLHGTAGPDGNLGESWRGMTFGVPSDPTAVSGTSLPGLMLGKTIGVVQSSLIPDGELAHVDFAWWNFAGKWPSRVKLSASVALTGPAVELTLTATNVWNQPLPIGLGWHPLFNVPSGDPSNLRLTVPSSTKLAETAHDVPTGREVPVTGTAEDFTSAEGALIGKRSLNVHYVDLQRASTADGPMVILRYPELDYGLRIIPIGDATSEIHVVSSPDQPWITVSMGTNLDDPLGAEWKNNDSQLKVLQPGQSMTWKVRLEVFSLIGGDDSDSSF